MSFGSEVKEEISKLKVWDNKSNLKQEEQLDRVCVREAFYKAGFISDPNKEYHLEIIFKQKKSASEILKVLNKYQINAKVIKRRTDYIVYIKDGEELSNFLAFIGASKSVLNFEDIRVMRDMRNNINRKVNCETANLTKTVNAALNQIEAINYLKNIDKFDSLDKSLKEIAEIRIENPDASLATICNLLEINISKSGLNHRLNKIIEISEEYKKQVK